MSDIIQIVGIVIASILSIISIFVSLKANSNVRQIKNQILSGNNTKFEQVGFKDCPGAKDCKSEIINK